MAAGLTIPRAPREVPELVVAPRLAWHDLAWRYLVVAVGAWWVCTSNARLLAIAVPGNSHGMPVYPDTLRRLVPWLPLLVGVPATLLMGWRRRHPTAVLVLVGILAMIDAVAALPLAWAYVSLAARRRPVPVSWPALAFVVACQLPALWWRPGMLFLTVNSPAVVSVTGLCASAVLTVAAAVTAAYVASRRDAVGGLQAQAEANELSRELSVLRGQAGERQRVAHEMDAVLAHRITEAQRRAEKLAFHPDLPRDEVRRIAQDIHADVSASLTDLRGVLRQLRTPMPVEAAQEKPQPVLADLPDLISDARSGGMRIRVENHIDEPGRIPTNVGRHAYRIVQEALGSARRHAVGALVDVSLSGAPGQGVTIVVHHPLRPGGTDALGAGGDVAGMTERAESLGGRLASRRDPRSFTIEAWLPW